jgi:PTH1 family peptidyl-tRNA hydrolase
MKLIVGLGNPGLFYSNNRHNIGFMCISYFAKQHDITFDKKKGNARIGTGMINGEEVVLARPQTYMNASGEAVCYLAERFKIKPDDLIIIHDDLDLPLGRIRIRQGGSAGGHNGIKSIIGCLESPKFVRVRIGIGRPQETEDKSGEVIDYVLGGFSKEEKEVITPAISRVSEALDILISDGLQAAMNKYNRVNGEKDKEPDKKGMS